MATLGLKEMGKFLCEAREKVLPCWLSQVAIAEFFCKMQRKTWYFILGVDAMPLSLKNLLLCKKKVGRFHHIFVAFSEYMNVMHLVKCLFITELD